MRYVAIILIVKCILSLAIFFFLSLFHLPYSYLSNYIRSLCLDTGLPVPSPELGGM